MNLKRPESKSENPLNSAKEKKEEGLVEKAPAEKEDKEIEGAKKRFEDIFDSHEDGAKRVEDILSIIRPILESGLVDSEKIIQSLKQCSDIKNKEEFIAKTASALEPIADLRESNSIDLEKLKRKIFIEQTKFIKLNEILSYGKSGDSIHIHLAPAKDISISEMMRFVKDGLEKLARTVETNKEIKTITATSWIVARYPGVMKRLGFTTKGKIDNKMRQKYFKYDKREIHGAVMTREEFLNKYLKEK